jgi:hypothetical protein
MSSPGVMPVPEPVQKDGWKRLFIKAAGLGAGATVVFVICTLLFHWYESRPKPPTPWNKQVLKAQFSHVTTTSNGHFNFFYVVENTALSDYRLNSTSEVDITIQSRNRLTMCEQCLALPELPIFIPAGRKMLVPIELKYSVPPELKAELAGSPDENEDKIVESYVKKKFVHLDGFIVYDQSTRLEIDFPDSWKNRGEDKK